MITTARNGMQKPRKEDFAISPSVPESIALYLGKSSREVLIGTGVFTDKGTGKPC